MEHDTMTVRSEVHDQVTLTEKAAQQVIRLKAENNTFPKFFYFYD